MLSRNVIPTAVLLAAGASTRLGRPKGLVHLLHRPLLSYHVQTLCTIVQDLFVVVGAHEKAYVPLLPGHVRVVRAPDWRSTSMVDSLRLALKASRGAPCLVSPLDCAPPTVETVAALLRNGAPAVPRDRDGRDGHPVLLGPREVDLVLHTHPEQGLRTVLAAAPRVQVEDPMISLSFNDEQELTVFRRAWRRHRAEDAQRR